MYIHQRESYVQKNIWTCDNLFNLYASMCEHMYVRVCTCTYVCAYAYIHIYTYMCVHVYMCVCLHCTYIHVYTSSEFYCCHRCQWRVMYIYLYASKKAKNILVLIQQTKCHIHIYNKVLYTRIDVFMSIYIYIFIYAYICTYMYMYI